jgi:hypothetical protein
MSQAKRIGVIIVMGIISCSMAFASAEHQLFTAVLQGHVEKGVVNYQALCSDPGLANYIEQLRRTDPQQLPSRASQLAFWINAYNAYTLKIVCDNYPIKSINELHTGGPALGMVFRSTVWHKKLVTINNSLTSLNDIEHKILRPVFQEPRIHFAIVCAAKGCPPLRSEAYEADRLQEQLDDQGRTFLAQEGKNSFDSKRRVADLSPIFSWFSKDFGSKPAEILKYLIPFLPEDVAEDIKVNAADWKIHYTPYDWSLNE